MTRLNYILCSILLLLALTATAGAPQKKHARAFAPQGDWLKKDMVIDPSKMKNFHFSTDDITDPQEREAMRENMRSNAKRDNSVAAMQKGNETLYTVKCVFPGEYQPYFAIYNPGFYMESEHRIWDESGETEIYYFQVPAGTYDVYAQYYSRVEGMSGFANLVHEDVVVGGDTEINFSHDELTEKVVIQPLLRDGHEALLPVGTYLDHEPWLELDFTNATATFSYFSTLFFREGCELLASGYAVADYTDGEETVFLSNKLSDKYHYIFQYVIEDNEGEIQISTTDIAGSESKTMNNYVKDFVKYDVPEFSHTPLYDEYGNPKYHASVSGLLWLDDVQNGGGGKYVEKTTPDVYWTQQPTEAFDLKTPIRINNVQTERTVIWEEEMEDGEVVEFSETYRAEMAALPALYTENGWEYINQNHSECGNFSYQSPENGPIVEYPGVPAYCYFSDQISQPIANSSPLLAFMTQVNTYPDATILYIDPQAYIGRYGEVRNCDQWNLHSVVKLNGKITFDSNDGGYLQQWCYENSTDSHEKGILEATFTNRNVLVDETIPGYNITSIKVDERNDDKCTPTPQMLIFKNTSGAITDRFDKAEDGIIEFSAGDFNWVYKDYSGYYTCDEADITVECAPYGTGSFTKLDVDEIPENYYMPGFGYFYRGSLANVTEPSENGWYDLRFTLTDKAGNEMVQRISPAFRIDANVGVTSPSIDGVRVWTANGTVTAAGEGITGMELYAPDGKLIAKANGATLHANGYRGIAIVRVATSDGTSSTHKLAI